MSIKISVNNYQTIIEIQNIDETKAIFLNIISEEINKRGWNQKAAAISLGIDQPKISHIKNGKTSGFSLERLLKFICTLEFEINVCIDNK